MYCIIDFTITFELKSFNATEDKWAELTDEEQQGIWRELDSRRDDMTNFFLEDYRVHLLSVTENRTMECSAYDCERLASFLNDTRGGALDSRLSRKFREAVSWWRNDVAVHVTISADDYHAGMAYCNARTGMAAAG